MKEAKAGGGWRDKLIDIEPYVAGEQPALAGLIKLNTNENPFPPSPAAISAISGFSAEGLSLYPDPDAGALRNAVSEITGVSRDMTFAGNGSDEVLAFAFRAFFNSDLPVLFPDVTYSFYPVWCRLFKIAYEEVPLGANFRIDVSGYGRANGGVVIANPNAPTGIAEDEAFFEDLLTANRSSVVIVDEAYVGFGAASVSALTKKYENLFVTGTFSKSRSLAGLRIGYGVGSPQLIAAIRAVKDSFNSYTLSSIQVEAGVSAARDNLYFEERASDVARVREAFKGDLRREGFTVTDSRANFIFALHEKIEAQALYLWLRERGILVRWFDGPRVRDWLRITIGTEAEMGAFLAAVREYMGLAGVGE
jgi:histidinol-phosphate aminotransferase